VLATALMFAFARYGGHAVRIEREDYPRFAFLGCCSFLNVVGTVVALGYLSATRYSIMQPSIPIWGGLISAALGYERLTPTKTFGVLLAVAGAVLIDTWDPGGGGDDDSSDVLLGSLLVVVQCMAMACLTVFQRPMVLKYPPACVTFAYYAVGSLITVLVCIGWLSRFSTADLYFDGNAFAWIALAYATVFATLFAYNAISWAVVRLPPGVVTAYSTLQPVGTAVLSVIVWGRVVTLPEVVGGALVALGLLATVVGRRWEQAAQEQLPDTKGDGDAVGLSDDLTYSDDGCAAAEPLLVSSPNDQHTNPEYSFFSPSKNKNTLRSIFL
jgi:drug/metabolite transporter (DMT)-like permease